MRQDIAIFWFRRDLRLIDNAALQIALNSGFQVLPIFIFDKNILDKLEDKKDARVLFIYQEIEKLKHQLEKMGSSLLVFHTTPQEAFKEIIKKYKVKTVFINRDYEPYAQARDKEIYNFLKSCDIEFKGVKDHVIFEKNEIIKKDGLPYTIFTPYSKQWKSRLNELEVASYDNEKFFKNFLKTEKFKMPKISEIGFKDFSFNFPSKKIDIEIIKNYAINRDFPAINGTSKLSLHLRFGTISIRELVSIANKYSQKFLDELIWRDFYQMIIFHFPYSANSAFKPQYDKIKWRNDEKEFQKWCEGKTGYVIVDAAMRQLNSTGFMHNRLRMVVASFLCKHLLIDWRLGEQYFAKKLLDYDLASNVGGWQWSAGCGCDAAPYFRIFNPYLQLKRFDPNLEYVKKWLPEFEKGDYLEPIVDHEEARKRCLQAYKAAN